MNVVFVLLPVVVPIIFWVVYHLHVDRHLPEPPLTLVLAFLLGVASFWIGLFFYSALGQVSLRVDAFLLADEDLRGLFWYALLVIGPVEELAKMVPFLLVILRLKSFDEPIDGIIFASFIALGFAAVENIRYAQFLSLGEALARGFAGPVIHIVFASIWGYFIGRDWLCRKPILSTVLIAWMVTGLLHGIYDFIVIGLPHSMLPVSAGLVAAIWVWRLRLIRDLHGAPAGPCPSGAESVEESGRA